jgi:pimeloyl-ACP methyl ester carboxylesterase
MKLLTLSFALAAVSMAQTPFQVTVTGHGRPVILIPGLSSSGETWDTTVVHYKDRFECHVLTVAGFAGVPRIPAPMLEKVRDGIADYIRQKKLERPIVIGHSLGGFLALDLAAHYPDLPGRLVIVDAVPSLAAITDPKIAPEAVRENVAQMRKYMGAQTQDMYERYVKSGLGTRTMVEKESDFDRIVAWGLKSDRTAVLDALAEMYATDLRDDLTKIKVPTLVFGTWIGMQPPTTRAAVEDGTRAQYAKLAGMELQMTDKAHHFIMWDDPEWMFGHIDRFLNVKATTVSREK